MGLLGRRGITPISRPYVMAPLGRSLSGFDDSKITVADLLNVSSALGPSVYSGCFIVISLSESRLPWKKNILLGRFGTALSPAQRYY
jgi:hypothetical protein